MEADNRQILGEIASEASLERKEFLVEATDQLRRFLDGQAERIRELGGMVLIDEDPDYLSIAPDGSFRSRSRFEDEVTGEWRSETEVIESAAELVELYNPADIYAAFAEAAREAAGMPDEPTATGDLMTAAGLSPEETVLEDGTDPYVGAADDWAAAQGAEGAPESEELAARRLYDLALTMQERSQHSEARLIEQFETAAANLSARLGDFVIVDDEDERLTLRSTGEFRGEVVPEEEQGTWRTLSTPGELVEFYDPTDVFGDVAEALAEAYPGVGEDADAQVAGAGVAAMDEGGGDAAGAVADNHDGDIDDDDAPIADTPAIDGHSADGTDEAPPSSPRA